MEVFLDAAPGKQKREGTMHKASYRRAQLQKEKLRDEALKTEEIFAGILDISQKIAKKKHYIFKASYQNSTYTSGKERCRGEE